MVVGFTKTLVCPESAPLSKLVPAYWEEGTREKGLLNSANLNAFWLTSYATNHRSGKHLKSSPRTSLEQRRRIQSFKCYPPSCDRNQSQQASATAIEKSMELCVASIVRCASIELHRVQSSGTEVSKRPAIVRILQLSGKGGV